MTTERNAQGADVLAVMDRAQSLLGEFYFNYQRQIGPFASQALASVHQLPKARAAVAELVERLEASNWRLANVLALIPEGRPERAQIEQDMADNRAALLPFQSEAES